MLTPQIDFKSHRTICGFLCLLILSKVDLFPSLCQSGQKFQLDPSICPKNTAEFFNTSVKEKNWDELEEYHRSYIKENQWNT
jgi:hypothetical protein